MSDEAPTATAPGRIPGPATAVERHPGPILVLAAVCWAGGGLIGRAAPIDGPALAFWRCLLAACAYHTILVARGSRPSVRSLRAAALGGAGFGLSVACLFVAYKSTTLVSAAVIGSLQPLVFGVLTHRAGDKLGRGLWVASSVAAVGTVVVVLGSASHAGTWSLRGDLFAAAGVAANMVYMAGTKRARSGDDAPDALAYQASMLVVASLVLGPVMVVASPDIGLPSWPAWGSIAGLVAVGGSGHLLFAAAQRHVSLAASSAIVVTEVIAVSVGATVLFDQAVTPTQALGMALVAGAVAVWLSRDSTA